MSNREGMENWFENADELLAGYSETIGGSALKAILDQERAQFQETLQLDFKHGLITELELHEIYERHGWLIPDA